MHQLFGYLSLSLSKQHMLNHLGESDQPKLYCLSRYYNNQWDQVDLPTHNYREVTCKFHPTAHIDTYACTHTHAYTHTHTHTDTHMYTLTELIPSGLLGAGGCPEPPRPAIKPGCPAK